MKGSICCFLALVGCASNSTSGGDGPADAPGAAAIEPRSCAQQIALAVTSDTGGPGTDIGSIALDPNGVDLCVSLAGSQAATHLQITSATEPGTTSSIIARLEDATFAPIVDGWDVTVGSATPQTWMNLEWNPPISATTIDVVVWLRGADHPVTTDISMALFVPLGP